MTRRRRPTMFEAMGGPTLMEFYPGMTPATIRSLTIREYDALVRHHERRQKEMNRGVAH